VVADIHCFVRLFANKEFVLTLIYDVESVVRLVADVDSIVRMNTDVDSLVRQVTCIEQVVRLRADADSVERMLADFHSFVRLDVLRVAKMKNGWLVLVTPYSLLELYRRFGGFFCLLQRSRQISYAKSKTNPKPRYDA